MILTNTVEIVHNDVQATRENNALITDGHG